jgi:hypothetical protein
MKNNFLFALLLLSIAEISVSGMSSSQAATVATQGSSTLFQLSEVSMPHPLIANEKANAKCGAGACGSTKKTKSSEGKQSEQTIAKPHDKSTKSEMKCGAGACGSKGKSTKK